MKLRKNEIKNNLKRLLAILSNDNPYIGSQELFDKLELSLLSLRHATYTLDPNCLDSPREAIDIESLYFLSKQLIGNYDEVANEDNFIYEEDKNENHN